MAVRIWLPDRPGTLAQVASQIAGIGGDVVGIEILERVNGVVVDEIVVELPREVTTCRLTRQLGQVDQLTVESIRPAEAPRDTAMRALDVAHRLVSAPTDHEIMATLVSYACRELRADWAAVVDDEGTELLAEAGAVPSAQWVARFAEGVSNRPEADRPEHEAIDTASLPMTPGPGALVLQRAEHPLLVNELHQLRRLVDIAVSCLPRVGADA